MVDDGLSAEVGRQSLSQTAVNRRSVDNTDHLGRELCHRLHLLDKPDLDMPLTATQKRHNQEPTYPGLDRNASA